MSSGSLVQAQGCLRSDTAGSCRCGGGVGRTAKRPGDSLVAASGRRFGSMLWDEARSLRREGCGGRWRGHRLLLRLTFVLGSLGLGRSYRSSATMFWPRGPAGVERMLPASRVSALPRVFLRPLPWMLVLLCGAFALLVAGPAVHATTDQEEAAAARQQYSKKIAATYNDRYTQGSHFLPSNLTTDNGEFIDPKSFPTAPVLRPLP